MRKLPLILSVVIAVFLLTITLQRGLTQDGANSCPTLVKQALQAVGNNCGGLTRNSACYGFNRVNATFSGDVTEGFFSERMQAGRFRLAAVPLAKRPRMQSLRPTQR